MQLVTAELDDPSSERCGRCANCAGEIVPSDLEAGVVRDAIDFLRRSHLPIEPRKQGIPAAERSEAGLALSMWGDAGWGSLVREGKFGGQFHDDLVVAVADMIRSWRPTPAPAWVTAVPSLRHPDLVPESLSASRGRSDCRLSPRSSRCTKPRSRRRVRTASNRRRTFAAPSQWRARRRQSRCC